MLRATVVISRSLDAEGAWELESSLAGLCAATPGLNALLVPHLYHLPKNSAVWEALDALEGRVVVFTWLHPRPAEWLLRARGISTDSVINFNLAKFNTPEVAHQAVLDLLGETQRNNDLSLLENTTAKTPRSAKGRQEEEEIFKLRINKTKSRKQG
jgi:hypothetical protein